MAFAGIICCYILLFVPYLPQFHIVLVRFYCLSIFRYNRLFVCFLNSFWPHYEIVGKFT